MIDSYNEVLKSIENIVKNVANKMGFDKTVLGVVTKRFDNSLGNYIVKIDNVEFEAISTLINLKVGDYVYITIPNGDYSETKIISGKKNIEQDERDINPRNQIIGLNEIDINEKKNIDFLIPESELAELNNISNYNDTKLGLEAGNIYRKLLISSITIYNQINIKCTNGNYKFAIFQESSKEFDDIGDIKKYRFQKQKHNTNQLEKTGWITNIKAEDLEGSDSENDSFFNNVDLGGSANDVVWLDANIVYILEPGEYKVYLKRVDDGEISGNFENLFNSTNIITLYPEWVNLIYDTYTSVENNLEEIQNRLNDRSKYRNTQVRFELGEGLDNKRLILPEISLSGDIKIQCRNSDYQFAIYERKGENEDSHYWFYQADEENSLIKANEINISKEIPWLSSLKEFKLSNNKQIIYNIYLRKGSYEKLNNTEIFNDKIIYYKNNSEEYEKFDVTADNFDSEKNNLYIFVDNIFTVTEKFSDNTDPIEYLFEIACTEEEKIIDESWEKIEYFPLDLENQRYQKCYLRCDFISNIEATTGSYCINIDFISKDEEVIPNVVLPHTLITGEPYNSIIPVTIEDCFDTPLELLVNNFKNLYKIEIKFIFDNNFYNDFTKKNIENGFVEVQNLKFILGFDSKNYSGEDIVDIYPIKEEDGIIQKKIFTSEFYYNDKQNFSDVGIDILHQKDNEKSIERITSFEKDDNVKIGWYEYILGTAPNNKNLNGEKNDLLKEFNWKESELNTFPYISNKLHKYNFIFPSKEDVDKKKRIIIADIELNQGDKILCEEKYNMSLFVYDNNKYIPFKNNNNDKLEIDDNIDNINQIYWLEPNKEYEILESNSYHIYIKKESDEDLDPNNRENIIKIYKISILKNNFYQINENNIKNLIHNFKFQKQVQNSQLQVKAKINDRIITSNTLKYINSDKKVLRETFDAEKDYLYTDDNYNGIYNIYNIDKTIIENFNKEERTIQLTNPDLNIDEWFIINFKGEKIKYFDNENGFMDNQNIITNINPIDADNKKLTFKLANTISADCIEYIGCKYEDNKEKNIEDLKNKINDVYSYKAIAPEVFMNNSNLPFIDQNSSYCWILPTFQYDGKLQIKLNNSNFQFIIGKEKSPYNYFFNNNFKLEEANGSYEKPSFNTSDSNWYSSGEFYELNCKRNEKYFIYIKHNGNSSIDRNDSIGEENNPKLSESDPLFTIRSYTCFKYYPITCGFFNTNGYPYSFSLMLDQSQGTRTFPVLQVFSNITVDDKQYWECLTENDVEQWPERSEYEENIYTIYDEQIYESSQDIININELPNESSNWNKIDKWEDKKEYSLEDKVYENKKVYKCKKDIPLLQDDNIIISPQLFNLEGYNIAENINTIHWKIKSLNDNDLLYESKLIKIKKEIEGNIEYIQEIETNKNDFIKLSLNPMIKIKEAVDLLKILKKYDNYLVLEATLNYNDYELKACLPIGLTANKHFLATGPFHLSYTSENVPFFDYNEIPFQQIDFQYNKDFYLSSQSYEKIDITAFQNISQDFIYNINEIWNSSLYLRQENIDNINFLIPIKKNKNKLINKYIEIFCDELKVISIENQYDFFNTLNNEQTDNNILFLAVVENSEIIKIINLTDNKILEKEILETYLSKIDENNSNLGYYLLKSDKNKVKVLFDGEYLENKIVFRVDINNLTITDWKAQDYDNINYANYEYYYKNNTIQNIKLKETLNSNINYLNNNYCINFMPDNIDIYLELEKFEKNIKIIPKETWFPYQTWQLSLCFDNNILFRNYSDQNIFIDEGFFGKETVDNKESNNDNKRLFKNIQYSIYTHKDKMPKKINFLINNISVNDWLNNMFLIPIITSQNFSPASLVNTWDQTTTINSQENGYILSSQGIFGYKNNKNNFSGVFIENPNYGDAKTDLNSSTSGIYGFIGGQKSYSLLNSGVLSLGNDEKNSLILDGGTGQLKNNNYVAEQRGSLLDLSAGILDSYNFKLTSKNILLDSSEQTNNYLSITNNLSQNLLDVNNNNYILMSANYNMKQDYGGYINLNTGNIVSQNGSIIVESNNSEDVISLFYRAIWQYNNLNNTYPIEIDNKNSVITIDSNFYKNLNSDFSQYIFIPKRNLEFDVSKQYKKNDIIIKDDKIWRAKKEISAGNWHSSDWEEVNVNIKYPYLNKKDESLPIEYTSLFNIGDNFNEEFSENYLKLNDIAYFGTSGEYGINDGLWDNYSKDLPEIIQGRKNEQICFQYLKEKGFSLSVICGILANIEAECSFIEYDGDPDNGPYGLFQWLGPRLNTFKDFSSEKSEIYKQLDFMYYNELTTDSTFKKLNELLNSLTINSESNAALAGTKWCTAFEFSPSEGIDGVDSKGAIGRGEQAKRYYIYYVSQIKD